MSRHLTKAQIEELHQDILTTVRQSYPSNGYRIVAVSDSSSSESLYVYVMYKRRLYYLRFSAHNNEIKGHGYTTFNLLQYSKWSQLRAQLHAYFFLSNQTNAYKLMSKQSQAAAKAAGRAVDVSADDFEDGSEE